MYVRLQFAFKDFITFPLIANEQVIVYVQYVLYVSVFRMRYLLTFDFRVAAYQVVRSLILSKRNDKRPHIKY